MRKSWKPFRYQIEARCCSFLASAIPQLSRRGCIALAQVLGMLGYWLDTRGRSLALANITLALGESLSPSERRTVVRMSYQNFVGTMLSLFWSPRINAENALEFIEPVGFESVLERAKTEGRGIVFVCSHHGNWEWAAIAFAMVGGRANIVAEDFKNPLLTEIFCRLRGRGQHTIISQERSVLRLLKAVMRGETSALIGDLNLDPCRAAVVVEAFGKGPDSLQMCATRMHAVLAKRGNALLVPALSLPLPDGRWRIIAQPPIESESGNERHLVQQTWNVFEQAIRERPDLWLWAYKHFKFRPASSLRPYPFYASHVPDFDRMGEEPETRTDAEKDTPRLTSHAKSATQDPKQ